MNFLIPCEIRGTDKEGGQNKLQGGGVYKNREKINLPLSSPHLFWTWEYREALIF